jgi:MFS family permease
VAAAVEVEQNTVLSGRAGALDPERRTLTVGLLTTISLIAFEGMAVATVMPVVASELDGLSWYGWAFSVFVLANLVGATAGGLLADQHGLGTAVTFGLALFACGLTVAGWAVSWPELLVARGLQGFGGGCLTALAYVAIARGYPPALRPRLLALFSSAWVLPALIGPALAGMIAQQWSWRVVFLGLLPLVLLAGALVVGPLRRLPGSRAGKSNNRRLLLAVVVAVGTLALLWGVGAVGDGETLLAPALAIVVGLLVGTPALRALLPSGTFSARPVRPGGTAVRGLVAFAFFGTEALIPLGLVTLRDLTPTEAGLFLTVGALAWVGGSWQQSRAEARDSGSGRVRRILAGLLGVIVGIVLVAVAILWSAVPVALGLLGWGLAGLGMGLAYPSATVLVLGAAQRGQEGEASSSLQVAEMVGTAVGTGLGGALLAVAVHLGWGTAAGLTATFVLTAVVGGVGVLAANRLRPVAGSSF